jgi:hypothetical protein
MVTVQEIGEIVNRLRADRRASSPDVVGQAYDAAIEKLDALITQIKMHEAPRR